MTVIFDTGTNISITLTKWLTQWETRECFQTVPINVDTPYCKSEKSLPTLEILKTVIHTIFFLMTDFNMKVNLRRSFLLRIQIWNLIVPNGHLCWMAMNPTIINNMHYTILNKNWLSFRPELLSTSCSIYVIGILLWIPWGDNSWVQKWRTDSH
jgi:hypothetical protein